jgi:hypothetical protein
MMGWPTTSLSDTVLDSAHDYGFGVPKFRRDMGEREIREEEREKREERRKREEREEKRED